MKSPCVVLLVTAPNRLVARTLARATLTARLAACVNLLPAIESHYWWEERIAASREILLILKTTKARLPALEQLILDRHPYDTPEFLVLPVSQGNRRYLDWIVASVRPIRRA